MIKPIPFIDLSYQTRKINKNVKQKWEEAIKNSSFVMGNSLSKFENEFSKYNAIKYSVGVGNGGDAIELALRALKLPQNSTVLLPVNTFIATATAISRAGLRVKFVDVNQKDGLINFEKLFSSKFNKTSCVVPVHLFGFMVDVETLKNNLKKDIKIIEDSSQAHGAKYNSYSPGNFSSAATYSFYPGKNLGAFGDGGALTTNYKTIKENTMLLRNYGSIKKYDHKVIGFNSRLDPLQAIVLSEKLKFLDRWNIERKLNFYKYEKYLEEINEVRFLKSPDKSDSVYHLTVAKVKKRNDLIKHLEQHQISTLIHYPIPLHKTKAYKNYEYINGEFSNAEKLAKNIISFPNYPGMSEKQIVYVCEKIKNFYQKSK